MDDRVETIFDLLPKEAQYQARPPRHASKFRGTVTDDLRNGKADYKTMGPAKVQTRNPNDFLKKKPKEDSSTDTEKKFQYSDADRRKPPVPKKEDAPVMGLKTNKNFITQNAVENIMSVPKKPEKNFVDTRSGDKHPLEPSGLEPRYINRKDFGEVPKYLENRKAEIEQAQKEYDAYVAEYFRRGAMQKMSEQEREQILHGLKHNWETLHHEYQGLSVVTDTAPKKNRKERMEAEMKQLERDIETIEKHRVIYIAN